MPAANYRGPSYPYSEAKIPRLINAHIAGQFVRVPRNTCRITRNYRPMDIIKIIGDHHVLQIQRRFRCQKCGPNDDMEVSFKTFMADEISGLPLRELFEVKMVKWPVWRDKKL